MFLVKLSIYKDTKAMCFHLLTWHFGQEWLHFGLRKLSPCNSIKVEPSARIGMSKIIKNEKKERNAYRRWRSGLERRNLKEKWKLEDGQ